MPVSDVSLRTSLTNKAASFTLRDQIIFLIAGID